MFHITDSFNGWGKIFPRKFMFETDDRLLSKAVSKKLGGIVGYKNIKDDGAVKAAEIIQ